MAHADFEDVVLAVVKHVHARHARDQDVREAVLELMSELREGNWAEVDDEAVERGCNCEQTRWPPTPVSFFHHVMCLFGGLDQVCRETDKSVVRRTRAHALRALDHLQHWSRLSGVPLPDLPDDLARDARLY